VGGRQGRDLALVVSGRDFDHIHADKVEIGESAQDRECLS
jgi:hypothetical protein